MAQNSKRGRGNSRRRQGGQNPNRSLDSTGPDVKIRGTAAQIYEKYQALARDASSSGDRIRAESLLQHAEHYYRLMKSMQAANERAEEQRNADRQSDRDESGSNDAKSSPEAEVETTSAARETEGESTEATPASTEADSGDEEDEAPRARRPRRRRAPRRSAEGDDNASSSDDSDASSDSGESVTAA